VRVPEGPPRRPAARRRPRRLPWRKTDPGSRTSGCACPTIAIRRPGPPGWPRHGASRAHPGACPGRGAARTWGRWGEIPRASSARRVTQEPAPPTRVGVRRPDVEWSSFFFLEGPAPQGYRVPATVPVGLPPVCVMTCAVPCMFTAGRSPGPRDSGLRRAWTTGPPTRLPDADRGSRGWRTAVPVPWRTAES